MGDVKDNKRPLSLGTYKGYILLRGARSHGSKQKSIMVQKSPGLRAKGSTPKPALKSG